MEVSEPQGENVTECPRKKTGIKKSKKSNLEIDLTKLASLDPNAFGKDGIKWTIGSSRKDAREYEASPGPARYDIFSFPPSTPAYSISPRREMDYRTITSNIETPCLRSYPKISRKTIGVKLDTNHWPGADSPSCCYTLPQAMEKPKIKIGTRPSERVRLVTPGPGHYSPRVVTTSAKMVTMPKHSVRDLFGSSVKNPGPGQYDVNRDLGPKEPWKGALRPIKKYVYEDEADIVFDPEF